MLNTKSGLNRLFPFAKKKPNIPTKASDKTDTKANKLLNEDKSCIVIKSPEQVRTDVLTENNEKAKSIQDKNSTIEDTKHVISETNEKILSPKDGAVANSKNKKSVIRKSSSVSDVIMEDIKKPKENYQRWNIPFSTKFKGKEFDKTLLTMQDLIYYNPVSNPIVKVPKVEIKEDDPDDDLLPIEPDQKPSIPNNCITPCIKVDADGKIIIDQETLTLNETGLEEKREELAKSKVIEESAFHSRSYSYKRKKEPSKQWNKDETLRFYKCLMNLGTDFSMIEQYFPGRTRAQIKRKYKTEEKRNPQLINGALTNSTHYDSVLIENMFEEEEDEPEVNVKPTTRNKRLHKEVTRAKCGRMSTCAYMMEEGIVLKSKRNTIVKTGKTITATNLKKGVLALQSLKTLDQSTTRNEILSPKTEEEKEEPVPKVRRLQDFHEEYEENITKYEEDSNSD